MHEATGIARNLSALIDLGFERVDVSPVASELIPVGPKTYRLNCSRPAMGTLVSISALGNSRTRLEEAIGRSLEEMDRLIMMFSRFESGSATSHLNSEGRIDGAPPEFSRVVGAALHFHDLSRGAFDLSVEPLVDLFRRRRDGTDPGPPTPSQIADALQLTGAGDIEVTRRAIRFGKPGMGITLDGIAKGYIVDRIAESLTRHKVKRYLVNAGGDIRTAGKKEDGRPWTVAVQDPEKSGNFPDTVHMAGGAVATSGSYEIYFDPDRTLHHIVSSRTGRSPDINSSVTVRAPSSMAADALATAVFVMGPPEGVRFIESLPRCECLVIDKHGRTLKSKGWKSAASAGRQKAGNDARINSD